MRWRRVFANWIQIQFEKNSRKPLTAFTELNLAPSRRAQIHGSRRCGWLSEGSPSDLARKSRIAAKIAAQEAVQEALGPHVMFWIDFIPRSREVRP